MTTRVESSSSRWRSQRRALLLIIIVICQTVCVVTSWSSRSPLRSTRSTYIRTNERDHHRANQNTKADTQNNKWSLSNDLTTDGTATETVEINAQENASGALPDLFPSFDASLRKLGFLTPTPIQAASGKRALEGENLLLMAPTGSGKTLSYLLPTLSRAFQNDSRVLVVAPTRELSVQLQRDATALLLGHPNVDDAVPVAVAVKGVAWPDMEQLSKARVLVGTPPELLGLFSNLDPIFSSFLNFRAVVLDEADVLLPLPPKELRTSLDDKKNGGDEKNKKQRNTPQDERRRQEQKRKLMAAKRQGAQVADKNKQLVAPTEQLLNMIATISTRSSSQIQVLAGSATASRKTLDRLNRSLQFAAKESSESSSNDIWSGPVLACRPVEDMILNNDKDASPNTVDATNPEQKHLIRGVTVPKEVQHKYVLCTRAATGTQILDIVANTMKRMAPQTSLIFLCGEFAKSPQATQKKTISTSAKNRKGTSQARRNVVRKQEQRSKDAGASKSKIEPISARKACSTLASLGIDAQPLHVALGLEGNDAADISNTAEKSLDSGNVFVTFEGSARGLHLDDVDAVFVVGRPSSAASYLHLAGRVGRSCPKLGIRPGTVVSFCSVGQATELSKWTRQVGGTSLEELVTQ